MYKNFNITESEKGQILNRLKENGYGQPTNKKVISEERYLSLEEMLSHYEIRAEHGSNVVLRSKNDKKYGIFNVKKGNWVDGYGPNFDEMNLSLYTNESEETFLLEKYREENGNAFYVLMSVEMEDMNTKIFGQSGFDEVMEGLTPVDDSNEGGNEEKYRGGPDTKYTDSVYEENSLNEGKQILIDTFKKLIK